LDMCLIVRIVGIQKKTLQKLQAITFF